MSGQVVLNRVSIAKLITALRELQSKYSPSNPNFNDTVALLSEEGRITHTHAVAPMMSRIFEEAIKILEAKQTLRRDEINIIFSQAGTTVFAEYDRRPIEERKKDDAIFLNVARPDMRITLPQDGTVGPRVMVHVVAVNAGEVLRAFDGLAHKEGLEAQRN